MDNDSRIRRADRRVRIHTFLIAVALGAAIGIIIGLLAAIGWWS